ncbi:MAG: hypothetical protein ACLUOF_03100, partial [Ruminococcus sp.]
IYRMVLQCRSIAQKAEPGQFVHLLPTGCTLRRPISICEINKSAGTLTIVFEVKGSGTDALANVRVGENLDILGPLGRGFTILPDAKHVVVVGGGIGNPPMLSLAQVYGARAQRSAVSARQTLSHCRTHSTHLVQRPFSVPMTALPADTPW